MLDPYAIILISLVSFCATYFGALAGGAGLVVTPILLSFGLPVQVALGTRRLSVLIGGGGGTVMTYVLIIVYGQTILESAGNRRLPLLTGNIVTTALFMWAGMKHVQIVL